ncbi:MAG: hypothetical protein RCO49_03130 [Rickettsia endosymbiont of Argas persicus]
MSNKTSTLLLKSALQKARDIINKHYSPEESLVDKLIAERRQETKIKNIECLVCNNSFFYVILSNVTRVTFKDQCHSRGGGNDIMDFLRDLVIKLESSNDIQILIQINNFL